MTARRNGLTRRRAAGRGPLGIVAVAVVGVVGVVAVVALTASCGGGAPGHDRSVILVTFDTTRADRLGAWGGTAVPTPRVDRFAGEGATFLDAYSQVPLTLPAHASMLTGRYPISHGVHHNGIFKLGDEAETLTERFADAGYDTAAFIAAYVLNRGFGTEQGFATYDDIAVDRFEGGRDLLFEAERTADEVNASVFRWLRGRGDDAGKFFLWVHYYDPHDPYDAPETPGRTLHGEGYDREISYLDHAFGDLLDELDRVGVLDDSIAMVVADHGESLGEHGERTHGVFLYEGAVRIPFALRAPGLVPAGARISGNVELVDVAPTLLELAELPALPEAEGESLVARLEGRDDGLGQDAFAESWMAHLEFGAAKLYMIRDGRFKFIEAPEPELYDLVDDPGESLNLVGTDRDRAAELRGRLTAWVEGGAAAEATPQALSAEDLARLTSLGYFDAGAPGGAPGGDTGRDPKTIVQEIRRLDEARDRLSEGDLAGAAAGAREILDENPWNHNARSTLVSAYLEAGRFADAERAASDGVALAAEGALPAEIVQKCRGLLAGALKLQGRIEEAESWYRAMLEASPDDEFAAVDLARMLAENGRAEEARALADEVLARSPRNGMALAARFVAESALGLEESRLATATALADVRAGDARTLVGAGDLLVQAGDHVRAAAAFEVALEQLSALEPPLLIRLGVARLRSGDPDGAIDVLEVAEALAPRDPRASYWFGVASLEVGREAVGRAALDRALAKSPGGTIEPLVALATWLERVGRNPEALETWQAAAAERSDDPRVREAIGRLGGS